MQTLNNYMNELERDKIINEILDLKLNRGSKLKIQKLQQKLIDIEKKLNLEND
tara:strand:+ start:598 stop:756 length:159 start_codon:yes stop_codon:yes gene_type:complete